jgi:hypothetical protein
VPSTITPVGCSAIPLNLFDANSKEHISDFLSEGLRGRLLLSRSSRALIVIIYLYLLFCHFERLHPQTMKTFHVITAVALLLIVTPPSSSAFLSRLLSQQREQYYHIRSQMTWPSTSVFRNALEARKKATEDDDKNSSLESSSPKKSSSMDPAKRAALDGVLNQIERSYGRGSIVKLGDAASMVVESISTGALTLDAALGGGFPKGRVVEIYGPESSGKTTLALHAIAECQKTGGTAAFVDAEHALDPIYGKSGCKLRQLMLKVVDIKSNCVGQLLDLE